MGFDQKLITALKCTSLALQEAELAHAEDYEAIVLLAMQYGRNLGVERSQVETILRQPLSKIFGF